MPASTFDQYYQQLQQGASAATTLEWYLQKIRETVTQSDPENKDVKKPMGPTTIQQAVEQAQKDQGLGEEKAREKIKGYVIETSGGFNQNQLGKMLWFRYDPKTKEKLPYYDMFPIVFIFRVKGNSAWGLNLHYLDPRNRARVLYSLMTRVTTEKMDPQTKLNITWKILKGLSQSPYIKACVKRYNQQQLRTRISVIDPNEWTKVVFMPLARFMKASQFKVWADAVENARKAHFK